MPEGEVKSEKASVPIASLARLWPNRQHESSWLKNLLCSLGVHRWQDLDISRLVSNDKATFCRWCPKIRYHGKMFE